MTKFTTIKVGYTAGVYGCSGEYFTTVIIDGSDTYTLNFSGMYGAEERISSALKALGYESFYTPSNFGKMVRNDTRMFKNEYAALEYLPELLGLKK